MIRVAKFLYYLLIVAAIVIGLLFYVGPAKYTPSGNIDPQITSLALRYTFFVIILAVALAIIFPIVNVISNPKNLLRNLIVVVGLAIVTGICYYFAKGDVLPLLNYEGSDNVPWVLKLVDTGLFLMYIAFAGALLAIVYSEIRRYLI